MRKRGCKMQDHQIPTNSTAINHNEFHQNGKITFKKGAWSHEISWKQPSKSEREIGNTRNKNISHHGNRQPAEIAEEPLVLTKHDEKTAQFSPRLENFTNARNRARTSGPAGGRRCGGRARRRRGREEEEQGRREGREVERGGEGPPGQEHYHWLSARAP